jgi:hypothetical protein
MPVWRAAGIEKHTGMQETAAKAEHLNSPRLIARWLKSE